MTSGLSNKHQEATETLVALAYFSKAYGNSRRTVIGVDECVAQAPVAEVVKELVGTGLATMAFPMWQERRVQADGTVISTVGTPSSDSASTFDGGNALLVTVGLTIRLSPWQIAYLYSYRRVIILSANRMGDRTGLRSLLRNEVAPVLNRDTSHGLSLQLLLQVPRTSASGYATRLRQLIPALPVSLGFAEIRV